MNSPNKNRRKKLCIVHPVDPQGSRPGGVSTTIKDLLAHLPDDFELTFIGTTARPNKYPPGNIYEITIGKNQIKYLPVAIDADESTRTKFPPMGIRFPAGIVRYRKLINQLDYEIMQFHRIESALPFLSKKAKKIMFIHNNFPHTRAGYEGDWGKLPFLYGWLEKYVLRRMDRIVVTHTDGKHIYQNEQLYPGLNENVEIIPPWVDVNIFVSHRGEEKKSLKKKISESEGIPEDAKWIIFSGRLEKQKNPFLLLESFSQVSHSFAQRKPHLLIVGSGSLLHQLQNKAAEKNIAGQIHFLGKQNREEIIELLNASDIMLVTSESETGPMSAFEALSCGLPVISTKVGMLPYVIKGNENGMLVNGDAREIAQTMEKMIDNLDDYHPEICRKSVTPLSRQTAQDNLVQIYESLI